MARQRDYDLRYWRYGGSDRRQYAAFQYESLGSALSSAVENEKWHLAVGSADHWQPVDCLADDHFPCGSL